MKPYSIGSPEFAKLLLDAEQVVYENYWLRGLPTTGLAAAVKFSSDFTNEAAQAEYASAYAEKAKQP